MFSDLLNRFQEFWGQRRWPVKLLILAVLLAPVGYFAGRPAWHQFTDWRCDRNMRLAAEALAAGNPAHARNLAYSVFRYRPKDIKCIRLTFKAMKQVGDLRRGDMARYLIHHPEATTEDRLEAWPFVPRLFPMAIVSYDWMSLGEDLRKKPEFFLPLVDRLVEEHRYGDAIRLFQPVDLEDTLPIPIEKRVLRILVACGNPKGIPEAQQRLTERIDRDAPDISALLPELDPIPREKLDPGLARALVRWLKHQENPGPAESLAVARYRLALAGEDKQTAEAIVDATISKWKSAAPAALARWLVETARPEAALRIIPDAQPDDAEFYRIRRDALAALGRWQDLLDFLAAYKIPPSGIPKLEWHVDATATAMHLGKISLQSEQWAAAMSEAKITPLTGFITLARMAKAKGLAPESEQALLEAIRTARGPLPFYSDLFPLIDSLYRQGKAEDMLNVATVYLPIEPGNPTILIHYTYLKTILGQIDDALTQKLLGPLLEKHGDNPALLRVFALQDLLNGDFAKAAQSLESVASDPGVQKTNPVVRILYGIALVGSGRPDDGLAVIESVDWKPLMPAESTIFDQLLDKAHENLDPQAKAKVESALARISKAIEQGRVEAEKRAKARAEAMAKARAEAEEYTKSLFETHEKAKAAAKARDDRLDR